MLGTEQRQERSRRVVPIIQNPDPDFRDTQRQSITLPVSWWERLDKAGAARGADRFSSAIQLTRWSQDLPEMPPTPPAADLRGAKKTNSVYLAAHRWAQMRAESERRGLSLNKVFQAHLFRGLVAEEADLASERKSKRP